MKLDKSIYFIQFGKNYPFKKDGDREVILQSVFIKERRWGQVNWALHFLCLQKIHLSTILVLYLKEKGKSEKGMDNKQFILE